MGNIIIDNYYMHSVSSLQDIQEIVVFKLK